jgi:hypothetical protein
MRWKNYTENTYDARLRLASVSAKLDNGSTATQAFTYDNLQRTATVNRVGDGTTTRLYLSDMVFLQISGGTTDYSEKRFRFGGKEIAGTSLTDLSGIGPVTGAPYLDSGARLYSPGSTTWLTQAPWRRSTTPLRRMGIVQAAR